MLHTATPTKPKHQELIHKRTDHRETGPLISPPCGAYFPLQFPQSQSPAVLERAKSTSRTRPRRPRRHRLNWRSLEHVKDKICLNCMYGITEVALLVFGEGASSWTLNHNCDGIGLSHEVVRLHLKRTQSTARLFTFSSSQFKIPSTHLNSVQCSIIHSTSTSLILCAVPERSILVIRLRLLSIPRPAQSRKSSPE